MMTDDFVVILVECPIVDQNDLTESNPLIEGLHRDKIHDEINMTDHAQYFEIGRNNLERRGPQHGPTSPTVKKTLQS